MKITKEQMEYLAKLSNLELSEAESLQQMQHLETILNHMDLLKTVDAEGAAAVTHSHNLSNITRPDEVAGMVDRAVLLKTAPEANEEAFIVPKTFV